MKIQNIKLGVGMDVPPKLKEKDGVYPFVSDTAIGIEIEMEGLPNPPEPPAGWSVEGDGSLRNYGFEYVMRHPARGRKILHALEQLNFAFKAAEAEPDMSLRCSVHVHVDCTDLTPRQIGMYSMALMIFEPLLYQYVKETRAHNPYCVPIGGEWAYTKSINHLLFTSGDMVPADDGLNGRRVKYHVGQCIRPLRMNDNRYATINLCSLEKYGTVEVRMLEGTISVVKLRDWINLLLAIKEWSLTQTPATIQETLDNVSAVRAATWVRDILGPVGEKVIRHVPADDDLLLSGLRYAQDCLYGHKPDARAKRKQAKPFVEQFEKKKKKEPALPKLKMKKLGDKVRGADPDWAEVEARGFVVDDGIDPQAPDDEEAAARAEDFDRRLREFNIRKFNIR